MDPAFLVWIPPIDEGNIINEMDGSEPHYEEILPRSNGDPGSNMETPDDEEMPKVPPKPPRRSISNTYQTNQEIKALLSKSPKHENDGKKISPSENIQMSDLTPKRLLKETTIDAEKETTISLMKANTDNRIADYYGLSDIQFADDGDEMDDEVRYIDENKRTETGRNRYKV